MVSKKGQEAKRELLFVKLKSKFDNLTLTEKEAKAIPNGRGMEYCINVIKKKYGQRVSTDCRECLMRAAFSVNQQDDPVSDDELCALGFPHV